MKNCSPNTKSSSTNRNSKKNSSTTTKMTFIFRKSCARWRSKNSCRYKKLKTMLLRRHNKPGIWAKNLFPKLITSKLYLLNSSKAHTGKTTLNNSKTPEVSKKYSVFNQSQAQLSSWRRKNSKKMHHPEGIWRSKILYTDWFKLWYI
jgi:hypothetical protein